MDIGLLILIVFILAPLLERLLGRGQQPPQGPPGQGRPGQPVPRQQPRRLPRQEEQEEEEVPFRSVPARHERDEEAAAGMLPDDLWEILTGEKRPQRPEAPAEPARSGPLPPAQEQPPATRVPPPVERRPDLARRAEARRQRVERERAKREEWERRRARPPAPVQERSLPPVDVRDRTPRERDPARLRPAGPPPGEADRYVRPVPVRAAPVVVSYDAGIPGDEQRHAEFHQRLDRDAAAAAAARRVEAPRIFDFDDPTELRRAIIMAEVLGRPKGME